MEVGRWGGGKGGHGGGVLNNTAVEGRGGGGEAIRRKRTAHRGEIEMMEGTQLRPGEGRTETPSGAGGGGVKGGGFVLLPEMMTWQHNNTLCDRRLVTRVRHTGAHTFLLARGSVAEMKPLNSRDRSCRQQTDFFNQSTLRLKVFLLMILSLFLNIDSLGVLGKFKVTGQDIYVFLG